MSETTTDRTAHVEGQRDAVMVGRLKGFSAVLLLLLAATSFAAGVPGLLDAGRWARLGEMAWLTPIAIDGGLVFFSASAMAWRAETAKASILGWLMVVLLTGVSVAAQIAHVLGDNPTPTIQDFVGAGVASMFPLLVLASTRQFEMLRFSRLIEREASRVAALDALNAPKATKPKKASRPVKAPGKTRQTSSQPMVAAALPAAQTPGGAALAQAAADTPGSSTSPAAATVTASKPGMALVGQARTASSAGAAEAMREAEVQEWVRAQIRAGDRPSAVTVGEMLGKSKASGLRLVNRVADSIDATSGRSASSAGNEAWDRADTRRAV